MHNHPFHLVTNSPWPLFLSMNMILLFGGVLFWFLSNSIFLLYWGLMVMFMIIFQWWRDVIRESTFQGMHTLLVVKGLKLGMLMFILSEVFFFISFFWSYFHLFLIPSHELGSYWPPEGVILFNPFGVPMLNTIILLSSGFSITWSHYSILINDYFSMMLSLLITIILGVIFSFFQIFEYLESSFCLSDSSFGSIFFVATGFHGLHVVIGSLFLLVCFNRAYFNHFSQTHHLGFEFAAWYWHFVDVVWLFLYLIIYFWIY